VHRAHLPERAGMSLEALPLRAGRPQGSCALYPLAVIREPIGKVGVREILRKRVEAGHEAHLER
jgi:hypothetical protein